MLLDGGRPEIPSGCHPHLIRVGKKTMLPVKQRRARRPVRNALSEKPGIPDHFPIERLRKPLAMPWLCIASQRRVATMARYRPRPGGASPIKYRRAAGYRPDSFCRSASRVTTNRRARGAKPGANAAVMTGIALRTPMMCSGGYAAAALSARRMCLSVDPSSTASPRSSDRSGRSRSRRASGCEVVPLVVRGDQSEAHGRGNDSK